MTSKEEEKFIGERHSKKKYTHFSNAPHFPRRIKISFSVDFEQQQLWKTQQSRLVPLLRNRQDVSFNLVLCLIVLPCPLSEVFPNNNNNKTPPSALDCSLSRHVCQSCKKRKKFAPTNFLTQKISTNKWPKNDLELPKIAQNLPKIYPKLPKSAQK